MVFPEQAVLLVQALPVLVVPPVKTVFQVQVEHQVQDFLVQVELPVLVRQVQVVHQVRVHPVHPELPDLVGPNLPV
jgi:hypothetical protein